MVVFVYVVVKISNGDLEKGKFRLGINFTSIFLVPLFLTSLSAPICNNSLYSRVIHTHIDLCERHAKQNTTVNRRN